ncbi:CocE/NonD family hydrolase [Streptomyces sp. FIT100]|uniref:CocE/NonD family hydrolase n=1 Tax=Streptomyces sp. FIT100 TaxID=2837956 RepID=UPI0021C6C251|nr:CocE/NonD family hydrolase [Streptomyces sp. FIT100]UUN28539.1 CocE/NonD family hydrolase [Streptomyces sp. FIT100]
MRIRTDYPYETRQDDVRIPLSDGIRLYARIWRPLDDEPVPALLEYLPHRLTDATAARDRQRHPWYAGHGYASVRVDMRGHGNSEGVPGDAYPPAELADGAAVVAWLAEQPWCDGGVGMFGVGRGGTTALAVAALAPEPLKAVVTVCSTDDRYDRPGGGAHARSAALLAGAARPPDPLYAGDTWRELWLNRLQAVEPALHTWLEHPTRDAYWEHGSIREEYGAIRAAVLAVGGWHDPYRDTVLRLVQHLDPARVRGLIGPWCHQYPDRGLPPGPAIGFLQETLRWWDHHLKGATAAGSASPAGGVMGEPLLRAWIGESHPPATTYATLPGRWVGDDVWPSPRTTPRVHVFRGPPVVVDSPQHTGVDAGRFVPAGGDADLPPDQREEDARSASFDFAVTERTEILGRPRVRLRIHRDAPGGQAVARLCDVGPDGSSTLVTRGVLDLSARHGPDRRDAWPPGATEDVCFELSAIGHAFPPGHRIRLAVSSAYWPWIWPSPGTAGFTLEPEGSSLELPVRAPGDTAGAIGFGEPEQSEPLGVVTPVTLDEPRPGRLVVRDVAKGEWRLETDPADGGTHVHPDGLEYTEEALDTYTIQERDPLSARARSDRTIRLHRPDLAWDIHIEARSETSCDGDGFLTSDELVCRHGQEVVFHRTWEKRIPHTSG